MVNPFGGNRWVRATDGRLVKLNPWGTDPRDVDFDHCPQCEREGGSHYATCDPIQRSLSEIIRSSRATDNV